MWRSTRNRWYPKISGAGATILLAFLATTTGLQLKAAAVPMSQAVETTNIETRLIGAASDLTGALKVPNLGARLEPLASSQACSRSVWPGIPARCLQGGSGRDVRMAIANSPVKHDMQKRFAEAFD